jgi:hypothetical protein
MDPTDMGAGHDPWDGQLINGTIYDVLFDEAYQSESSPVSAIGSYRIDEVPITIRMRHKLPSNIEERERNAVRALVLADGDKLRQALHYPNNLDTTSAATATNILSGLLVNLRHGNMVEDWDASPPRIESDITGTALVMVTQATS